ncbi:hypothetical protein, partial [Streptomyces edwardsiae]
MSGRPDPDAERTLKTAAVTDTLSSELSRLCRAITTVTARQDPQLPAAVAALISRIGVYRSDYPSLGAILPVAMQETSWAAPELTDTLSTVATALSTSDEVVSRFNQLCGAATAKAVEDCLFYRDARLVSLNEV